MKLNICTTGLLLTTLAGLSMNANAETGLPWSSSFETGNISEWNGFNSGVVQISTNSPADGSYAASVDLVANTLNGENYLEHYFGDHIRTGLEKVEEVWLKFSSKFESGYQWPDRQSHKIALINLTNGSSSQRTYQVYIYATPSGEYAIDHTDIADWRFYGLSQNVGAPAAVRFDQWDELKLYTRLNTPGQSDGIIRLWINGELKLDYTGLDIRENTTDGMNKLIQSSYTSAQSGGNGRQWYDNWSLTLTDPDAGSPPSPPVMITQ
ncbi:hypothetical protein MNBD_GAMMA15-649 [hydrothermal vent metagenome]|uniref:3-keto-disaccharide hydrolase domain-containing protein n=1 Tax=hydrothermal vent metagenome TaxID=652676 RepID=A0A3B0Y0I9_9ZZZZ